jgi:hypothetical protein
MNRTGLFNPTGEQVIRHRGRTRDEDGKLTPEIPDEPLTPIAVQPGGGSGFVERARDGETTAFTVYFEPGTDVTSKDELTVRGDRFPIVVNDWRHPIGGLEVLCTRGHG